MITSLLKSTSAAINGMITTCPLSSRATIFLDTISTSNSTGILLLSLQLSEDYSPCIMRYLCEVRNSFVHLSACMCVHNVMININLLKIRKKEKCCAVIKIHDTSNSL